jgi:hypothetical protein
MTDEKKVFVNPVAEVAKESSSDDIRLLKSGVRVRLKPVPAPLIDAVVEKIPEPEIPIWHNEAYDRDEPNPSDPQYVKDLADADRKKGLAAIDAMAMFGVELVDGLPPDEEWLDNLRKMESMNLLDLSEYDMDDLVIKELVFKKFVAVTTDVLQEVTNMSGLAAEDVEAAEESFPGQ